VTNTAAATHARMIAKRSHTTPRAYRAAAERAAPSLRDMATAAAGSKWQGGRAISASPDQCRLARPRAARLDRLAHVRSVAARRRPEPGSTGSGRSRSPAALPGHLRVSNRGTRPRRHDTPARWPGTRSVQSRPTWQPQVSSSRSWSADATAAGVAPGSHRQHRAQGDMRQAVRTRSGNGHHPTATHAPQYQLRTSQRPDIRATAAGVRVAAADGLRSIRVISLGAHQTSTVSEMRSGVADNCPAEPCLHAREVDECASHLNG
jgi:hypothetical protein